MVLVNHEKKHVYLLVGYRGSHSYKSICCCHSFVLRQPWLGLCCLVGDQSGTFCAVWACSLCATMQLLCD